MNRQRQRPPSFGILATVVIGVVLLTPVAVWKLTNAEPFPAIILPGSPSQLHIADGQASVTSVAIL